MASRMVAKPVRSRVTRAGKVKGVSTGSKGPKSARADLKENVNAGAKVTRVGKNTPVPPAGRSQSSVPVAAPNV